MKELQPLYFGCKHGAGHYLHDVHGNTVWRTLCEYPHGEYIGKNDGKLAPQDHKRQASIKDGVARDFVFIRLRNPDAMLIAFWDYTVDSRPGSNSMFLIPGATDALDALKKAKELFPWAWRIEEAAK